MDSFDYGKALSEMWTLGGKAFLEAQQQALARHARGRGGDGPARPGRRCPAGCPGGARVAMPPAFPNLAIDAGEIGKAGQALAELWTRRATSPAPWRGGCRSEAPMRPQRAGADSTVTATLRR